MARSRNIKPGFFTNELLVELPFEQRLLFIGLWTIADREGRLDDRPKQIKIKLFPGDNMDVEAGLTALAKSGFILRYSAGGSPAIQVLNWRKHQQPHFKEKASTIAAPDKPEAFTPTGSEQSPGQVAGRPESDPKPAALIPDSGFLIPDSLQQPCPAEPDRDDFGTWYTAYPRHESKDDARKAWDRRLEKRELPPLADLLAAIEWQRKSGCLQPLSADGRSLIPLPATYLNKGKFKDERPKSAESVKTCYLCGARATKPGPLCDPHYEHEKQFAARAA